MAIRVTCPQCHKTFRTKDENAGKKAKCAGCSTIVVIPWAAAAGTSPPSVPPASDASPFAFSAPEPRLAQAAKSTSHPSSPRRYECSECGERFVAADLIKKQGRIICRTCRAEMGNSDADSEGEYRCPKCHKTEVEITSPNGLRILRHVLFFFPIMPIFIAVTGGVGLFFSVMMFAVYKGLWSIDDRARCTSCGHSWLELELRHQLASEGGDAKE